MALNGLTGTMLLIMGLSNVLLHVMWMKGLADLIVMRNKKSSSVRVQCQNITSQIMINNQCLQWYEVGWCGNEHVVV